MTTQADLLGPLEGLEEPDLKTPAGRMRMAEMVLEMVDRNLELLGQGGQEAAGISPAIYAEAVAVSKRATQSLRIWNLPLVKAAGLPPGSTFILRGRSILGILTLGRD